MPNRNDLSREEIKAIIESYVHWNVDIVQRFEAGDKLTLRKWTDGNNRRFKQMVWKDGSGIKDTTSFCALCMHAFKVNTAWPDEMRYTVKMCTVCPYYKHYGYTCDSHQGHWTKWNSNRCIETAIAMRDAIIEIICPAKETVEECAHSFVYKQACNDGYRELYHIYECENCGKKIKVQELY